MRPRNSDAIKWHARIDQNNAHAGTGFLIDRTRLLTCAHVVGDGSNLTAVFSGIEPRQVASAEIGPWSGSHIGLDDYAILHLAEPVDRVPAKFASLNTVWMHPDDPYQAWGYPFSNPEGIPISLRVRTTGFVGDTTLALEGDQIGKPMVRGFSGSAVCREGTGEVVGMITSSDKDHDLGAMLPMELLVKYFPPLSKLLPLGPFSPLAYEELRGMLGGLNLANLEGCFTQALGQPPLSITPSPGMFKFVDAMSVIEAICEMDRKAEEIKIFTSRAITEIILNLPSSELHPGLIKWMRQFSFPPDSIQVSELAPAYVITKITPSAEANLPRRQVTIWTVQNDEFEESPIEVTVAEEQLQAEVEKQIHLAIKRIPNRVPTVFLEFVLPRKWFSLAVDEWTDRDDQDLRFGWSRPLVLRDLDSFDNGPSRELKRRSDLLNQAPEDLAGLLRRRDCDHDQMSLYHFQAWLRGREQPLALAMSGKWAEEEWILAAVAGGVPALFWPRNTCRHGNNPEPDCQGMLFTKALGERLSRVRVDGLAMTIRELRAEAGPEGEEFHCGHGISVYLENSDRRPPEAPLGYAEVA